MVFYADYEFKPYGGLGTSSIIKTEGENIKVVEETKLSPQEDSEHEEVQKAMTEELVTFDTAQQSPKQSVTEIKMGSSGVIRKRNGGFVQMNDNAEKFKKINTGVIAANNDKEVHQKIQLMTVKQSTDVEPRQEQPKKIITIKPKKENVTEVDILNNIMMNKIKIEKKGTAVPDGTKLEVKVPKPPVEDKK